MSFTIEAPAEANPLTIQTLFHVLQSASSSDQQQVQTGAQQLKNWDTHLGFYQLLQTLYLDYSLPVELRYLSVIHLKNGIDRRWRKTATNALSKDEKEIIRSRLLESAINEPDGRVALQISIMISKVIRHEFPHDWPDPISSMLQTLHQKLEPSKNPVHVSRILLVLLYVIKELSTSRLQRPRKALQSVTPKIISALSLAYNTKVRSWLSFLHNGGNDEGGALDSVEQSLLALRALRRLIISGYDVPNRHPEIRNVWSELCIHFGQMLALINNSSTNIHSGPRELIQRQLMQIAKLHMNMAKDHPAGYALLPNSIDLAHGYWGLIRQFGESYGSSSPVSTSAAQMNGTDREERFDLQEKLCLTGLLLTRACMKMVFNPAQSFKYQQPEDREEKNRSKILVRETLLSDDFARTAMETIVTHYFVFTKQDLEEWGEDPEEWEQSQEYTGDDWEISLRTCAEKLFSDLMIHFKDLLVHPLLTVFESVATLENDDVMLKDSIYAAVGIAAPVLDKYPSFNLSHFIENVLSQEVQKPNPGYAIIRRRAAIFLGQWLPIKEGLNRPLVYQIFRRLLEEDDNMYGQVVRITAARQLKNVIDSFEFAAGPFQPYAPEIISRIMFVARETSLPETKLAMLQTLSTIVVKMEEQIVPLADEIILFLQLLWQQAEEFHLLQQIMLGVLSALCTAMQAESRRYHPVIIPLIESSIEPSSNSRIYLLEDALELWTIVLSQTPSENITPETVAMVRLLFPLYEVASENLRKGLEITEEYIYLIPSEMLINAAAILKPLASILGTVKRDATGLVTSLVDLFIQSAANLGGSRGVEQLIQPLFSSNILTVLLSGLHDAYVSHQTTGPNRQASQIDGVVETDYWNVFARLVVVNPTLFLSTLRKIPHGGQTEGLKPIDETLGWLLTEWFSHMDSIGNPAHKKLNCLALTSLLGLGQPWMLSRLQSLMALWTDVVGELVTDYSQQQDVQDMRDSLVYENPNYSKPESESPGDARRRILEYQEPIHRIDIRTFIREKLAAAVDSCGGMDRFQSEWIQNVDQDVVKSFGALGIV